jgi:replicative DNA helicase
MLKLASQDNGPLFAIAGDDRKLPSNLDAEIAILGGLLLDPGAIERVSGVLSPSAFYFTPHRAIYSAILDLSLEGLPTDPLHVCSRLRDLGQLEKIGGQSTIARMWESTVSAVNIDAYADLVVKHWQRRQLIAAGHEIAELAMDLSESLPQVCDRAEQKLFGVTQQRSNTRIATVADVTVGVFQRIEDLAAGLIPPGIATGFYDFDAMTQGLQRSNLVIVAGRPGSGKTAFALNVAQNIASMHGLPVVVFSMEMEKDELVQRMLSCFGSVTSSQIRTGQLLPDDWTRLGQAISKVSHLPVSIDDTPGSEMTVEYISSTSRRMLAERGDLGAIVIDYLQLMGGAGESSQRVGELSQITRSLKGLAKELKVPIILLSQLNRGVESRQDKRPLMSDLRDSGAIEQDADIVLMLYRDEYYNPDTVDRGIAEINVCKHRNGPTGAVKLLFEGQFTRFKNLAR